MLPILATYGVYRLFRARFAKVPPQQHGRRAAVVAAALGVFASPYRAFKLNELQFVLTRVPEPLGAAWIEHRQEKSWGSFGLPGDNETGFVVYRLTDDSADWARQQGGGLAARLPGGRAGWRPTPVDVCEQDRCRQSSHEPPLSGRAPDITNRLDCYGYVIPLAPGDTAEADHAIIRPGSFYAYGAGGNVTIIDPARGKVYFAYAG